MKRTAALACLVTILAALPAEAAVARCGNAVGVSAVAYIEGTPCSRPLGAAPAFGLMRRLKAQWT